MLQIHGIVGLISNPLTCVVGGHTHWPKDIYATPSELHVSGSSPNGLPSSRHIAPMITSGILPIFPVQSIKDNKIYVLSSIERN
jgi:hypothetical protein